MTLFKGFIVLIGVSMLALTYTYFTSHTKIEPTPTTYCHACQCGKVGTKCIDECNSHKVCAIMCANQCNEKKMTVGHSPELQEDFNLVNLRFFGDRLPKTNVYLSNQVENDWIGLTTQCGRQPQFCIIIDEPLAPAPREQEWTLRHEMCHIATFNEIDPNHPHGPKWQECMISLADKGAFTGVW